MKIVFSERSEMIAAIRSMEKLIKDNGYLTVGEVKKICFPTETVKDTDSIYGWNGSIEWIAYQSDDYFGCWELKMSKPLLLANMYINIARHINGMTVSRYIAANLLQNSSLKGEKYYASEDELSEVINDILESILVIQKQEETEVKIR